MNAASDKDFGWSDAEAPFYHHYIIPAVESQIPPPLHGAVLDLGCGNGRFVNDLIAKGYEAYGVDTARDGIRLAEQKNSGHFFVCDVTKDPLPDPLCAACVKTVVSMEVIEHLYSPRGFVEFAARMLRSNGGGVLILSTPYHGYLKNLLISLLNKWDYHWGALWEGGHIKFWSRNSLERLLREAGFRNIRFEGVGRFPYLWRHMVLRAEIEK